MTPDTDVVDVTLLMADYNLMTVPVVDTDDQLLGVITVDDILEATIPEDWRRREPLHIRSPCTPSASRTGPGGPASKCRQASKPDQPCRPEPKG